MHLKPQRPSRLAAVALTAAGLVLVAGCGSHATTNASPDLHPGAHQSLAGSPGSTGTATAAAAPTMNMPMRSSAAAPAPAVHGHQVAIKNFAFSPAALVVSVGTTVTWTNQDTEPHTVTGGPLHSAALSTGQSYSYTFTAPGTASYLCTIHPFMTATVTVTK